MNQKEQKIYKQGKEETLLIINELCIKKLREIEGELIILKIKGDDANENKSIDTMNKLNLEIERISSALLVYMDIINTLKKIQESI